MPEIILPAIFVTFLTLFDKIPGWLNLPILRVLLGDRGQRDRETRTGLQCTVEKSMVRPGEDMHGAQVRGVSVSSVRTAFIFFS